jgi:hypothetical protein
MLTVFKPFTEYITSLVKGKLDRYFNSTQPEDFVTDPNVGLPTHPMLLLHDLGRFSDMGWIKQLFVANTVFVSFCIISTLNGLQISLGIAIYLLPLVLERLTFPSKGSAIIGDFISLAKAAHSSNHLAPVTLPPQPR